MKAAPGFKLRRVVLWIFAALFGAGVLSAHVYKQNLYIRLSREALKLDQEKRLKLNELAALELDVKGLMRRQRLEQLAVGHFGLAYAGSPEVVYAGDLGHDEKNLSGEATGVAMLAQSSSGRTETWVSGAVKWLTDGL